MATEYSDQLPAEFFTHNRAALGEVLTDSSAALFFSGRSPHKSADEQYPFFANRSFFYLTGIEQDESTLLIVKEKGKIRETLFIKSRDSIAERWNGCRLSQDEACGLSGFDQVSYLEHLIDRVTEILSGSGLHLALDLKANGEQSADFRRLAAKKWPEIEVEDLSSRLIRMRMIKQPEEVAMIRKAISLTHQGIEAIMRAIRPGQFEYQVWGAFQYALDQAGCLSPAFPSIIATGDNAFCLHYMTPMSKIAEGDLVLIDVGATAGCLNADISRVYPASGRFSDRQKAIYELVRACQETAFKTIRPGICIQEVNEACKETAKTGLVRLGILAQDSAAAEHYWHGVSHHLGLDVHDPADREIALEPGMVLTVEPGVYVPDWHVGIRIEDDVLVTADGCVNLSHQIPREISEIEALMALVHPE